MTSSDAKARLSEIVPVLEILEVPNMEVEHVLTVLHVSHHGVTGMIWTWLDVLHRGCRNYQVIFDEAPDDWHMRRILKLPEAKTLDQLGRAIKQHWKRRPGILLP